MSNVKQFVPRGSGTVSLVTRDALFDMVAEDYPEALDGDIESTVDGFFRMRERVNYPSRRGGAPCRRIGMGVVEPLFPPVHYIRGKE